MMTVKSERSAIVLGILCYLPFLYLAWLFFRINAIAVAIVTAVAVTFLCFRYVIAVSRAFRFDADGLTIRLLRFSRHYRWDEITVRQESFADRITVSKPQYAGSVCFLTREMHKPRALNPLIYCILLHPLGFAFVNYDWRYRAPEIYPVKREEFLQKCRAWQNGTPVAEQGGRDD